MDAITVSIDVCEVDYLTAIKRVPENVSRLRCPVILAANAKYSSASTTQFI